MKRSAALAPLSRDHHHALVVAAALRGATDATGPDAARRFLEFLDSDGLAHFAIEEELVLPAASSDERGKGLVRRVIDDHEHLRSAAGVVRRGRCEPADLRAVGERLRAHVRLEERELFPYLETTLTPDSLLELGARVTAAVSGRIGPSA